MYEIAAVIIVSFLSVIDLISVNNDIGVGELNVILTVAILMVASGIAVSYFATTKTFEKRFNIE